MGWIERRYVIETFQKQTVVLCLAHIDCKKSAERIIYNNCRQGSVVDCDAALGFKAFNGYHYAEVAALIIASNPNAGSIMALVSNAWGIFGAAFGPAIMLSLFWKRFNFKGAVAGIITGAAVDILWYAFLTSTGIYELLPGFVFGLIAAVVVTLCTKEPSKEVYELFDKAEKFDE